MPVLALMMERCPVAGRDSLATKAQGLTTRSRGRSTRSVGRAGSAVQLVVGDRELGAELHPR